MKSHAMFHEMTARVRSSKYAFYEDKEEVKS